MPTRPPVFLYLATNRHDGEGECLATRVGVASDVRRRVERLNAAAVAGTSSSNSSRSKSRASRRPLGTWRVLLAILVPPRLSARALALQWSADTRKPHGRFQYGVEQVAWHFGLPYLLDDAELGANSALTAAAPAFMARVRAQAARGQYNASAIAELAERAAADTLPLATTALKTLSFARADRPRARYRRTTKKTAAAAAAASSRPAAAIAKSSSPAAARAARVHLAEALRAALV